jgi:hypothetical protein
MRPELKTKRYFPCPACGEHEFAVEHLLGDGPWGVTAEYPKRTAGPWYCDNCGAGWRLTYDASGVDVEPHTERKVTEYVILVLPPQTEPVRFKVKHFRFTPEIDENRARYFFEEHTCAVNWLRDVEEVSIGTDDDPHGLWKLDAIYDADASASKGAPMLSERPDKEGP